MPDGTLGTNTGERARRRWSAAAKLRIGAESEAPESSVNAVAARHEVRASLVSTWRRQAREGWLRPAGSSGFVPMRLRVRQAQSAPLLAGLKGRIEQTLARISGKSDLAVAIRYALTRWHALTLVLRDGRACLDNYAAERAMRPVARKEQTLVRDQPLPRPAPPHGSRAAVPSGADNGTEMSCAAPLRQVIRDGRAAPVLAVPGIGRHLDLR